jgi:Ni/Co efflux regulator RcnB
VVGGHQNGSGAGGARTGAFTGYPGGWRGAPNGQGGGNPHGGSHTYSGGQGSGSPGGSPNYQGGGNPHGGYQGNDWRGGNGGANNDADRGDWRTGRDFHPGFGAPGYQPGGQRPRYSQQYFPRSFSLDRRYHWRGDWRAPPGFYNRHWNYGDRLPWGWFSQSYWIDDYYDYSLPVPPYGYEWIRVGDDAVLVDLSSGTVVETAPDAFY